jgi:hypothetical protein
MKQHIANPKAPALRGLQSTLVLGATALCAANTQAAVTRQVLNLTSSNGGQGIGFSYNPVTFEISNSGERVGAVMARSGYQQGKGMYGQSYLNGDYNGGSNQAQITTSSVAYDSIVSSSLSWTSRVYFNQGLSDTYYGIRFDQGGGNYNYGWVNLKTPGTDVVFVEASVNQTASQSIRVSTIPEPSTSLLGLAGGAAALMAIRRRKVA